MTHLTLTPSESVTVRRSTPEAVEVEVRYEPGGERPPAHLHPAQDETFEVLAGVVSVRIGDVEHTYGRGETFEVARGTAHQLWNAGDEPARAIWLTRPAGRTLEWFEALDALQRSGRVTRNGMPGPLTMAVLLTRYRDVFRIAAWPPWRKAAAA
jgi:quercetin dioxygenase-like cupin family protein